MVMDSEKKERAQTLGEEPTASHALAVADHEEKGKTPVKFARSIQLLKVDKSNQEQPRSHMTQKRSSTWAGTSRKVRYPIPS